MEQDDYVSYEVGELLQEIGYDLPVSRWWVKLDKVKESIKVKYGNFSDDGYFDLTVDGGGSLQWGDVYEHKLKFTNSLCAGNIIAPSLWDAQKWLRKKFSIIVEPRIQSSDGMWMCDIWDTTGYITTLLNHSSYESALNEGIKETLIFY